MTNDQLLCSRCQSPIPQSNRRFRWQGGVVCLACRADLERARKGIQEISKAPPQDPLQEISLPNGSPTAPASASPILPPISPKSQISKRTLVLSAVAILGMVVISWLGSKGLNRRGEEVNSTIKGGAWVIRKSGESVLLRGMEVRLIHEGIVDGGALRQKCKGYLDDLRKDLVDSERKLQTDTEMVNQDPGLRNIGPIAFIDEDKKRIAKLTGLIGVCDAQLAAIQTQESLSDAYHCLKTAASYYGEPDVDDLVRPFSFETTHADAEGHYRFEKVPKGKYFIVAEFASSFNNVQWFLPVEVKASGEVNYDLFNDTAEVITN